MKKKKILIGFLAILTSLSILLPGFSFAVSAYTGNISSEIIEQSAKTAVDIEAEGIVLLKNEDGTLPLAGKKLNVFGSASITPFLGGTGSGSIISENPLLFYDALELAGIEYNDELKNLYEENNENEIFKIGNPLTDFLLQMLLLKQTLKEMPVEKISDQVMERAKGFSSTALVMIGRTGTEGEDLPAEDLHLSEEEERLIKKVTENFQEVIVLFNIGNVMEMGWLEAYPQIKAAAIVWIPGEFGMEAVAKMLKGEISPSGKLADTVAYSLDDHPSSINFGDFTYSGSLEKYLDYREGIYVGYRYFETFAKDKVQFPFGFGLSYADFDFELLEIFETPLELGFKVRVTNTGDRAGKEVAQLYFKPPYEVGGIEKSEIVLGAYQKTKLLQPGESDTLILTIDQTDMVSYDYKKEEAWVLDAGTYQISLRRDVRREIFAFDYSLGEKTVFKADRHTGKEIKNLFDFAYDGFEILSRQDPVGTFPILAERKSDQAVLKADRLPKPKKGQISPIGLEHSGGVINLQDVYEDPTLWEPFLDQLTLEELTLLVTAGGYKTAGIERLGIPQTADNDGPASIKGRYGVTFKDTGAAYPCATALACTFNDELAYEMGQSVAREAAYIGTDIWYAPGGNIHRNPRGGRNFEYFSEDPLLAGKMSAKLIAGAKAGGLLTTIKHYALNDQEQNRMGVYTWADEQTMREIYLKAFEIAFKEGGGNGVMTGFNRLGPVWCGASAALNKELLREEWGFEGFVVSDFALNFTGFGYMNPALAVYGGNDTMLTGLYPLQKFQYTASIKYAYTRDPVGFGRALRESAKNICLAKMQTRAFLDPQDLPEDSLIDNLAPPSDWDFFDSALSPLLYLLNNIAGLGIYFLRNILGL